jgi:hypothetical protein
VPHPPTHTHTDTHVQVILDTLELSARIKKTPVVVGNCTGFAVNRVFFPYTMSACMLVRARARPGWGGVVGEGVFPRGAPRETAWAPACTWGPCSSHQSQPRHDPCRWTWASTRSRSTRP